MGENIQNFDPHPVEVDRLIVKTSIDILPIPINLCRYLVYWYRYTRYWYLYQLKREWDWRVKNKQEGDESRDEPGQYWGLEFQDNLVLELDNGSDTDRHEVSPIVSNAH